MIKFRKYDWPQWLRGLCIVSYESVIVIIGSRSTLPTFISPRMGLQRSYTFLFLFKNNYYSVSYLARCILCVVEISIIQVYWDNVPDCTYLQMKLRLFKLAIFTNTWLSLIWWEFSWKWKADAVHTYFNYLLYTSTERHTRMRMRRPDMIFHWLLPILWQMHSNSIYLLEKSDDWTFSYYLIFIMAVSYVSVPSNSSDGHMQADGWQEKIQTRRSVTTSELVLFYQFTRKIIYHLKRTTCH